MAHNNTAFQQVLTPLSRHEFEKLAKHHHVGQKLRSASRWDQFCAMLMSQFTGRQSLRDIAANLLGQQNKLYHLGAKPIARSTLARINEKQPHELYQALFFKLLQRFSSSKEKHKFRFKNPLISLDASLIDLSLKIFPWATFNHEKAALKLHVGLNNANLIPEFVSLTDAKESDVSQGRVFSFKTGSIVVFDKGYADFKWYQTLTSEGVYFVTRLKRKTRYSVLDDLPTPGNSGVTSDKIIELDSPRAKQQGAPKRLRLVAYTCPETGQEYQFLTNHFNLSSKTIAAIYKDRWQIELFFKTLKQNLKIHAFVGTSRNAILTQIWIAMIAYLLLSFARHSAREGWSVQRIMRILQVSLFERCSLKTLLDPSPPDIKGKSPQLGIAW